MFICWLVVLMNENYIVFVFSLIFVNLLLFLLKLIFLIYLRLVDSIDKFVNLLLFIGIKE